MRAEAACNRTGRSLRRPDMQRIVVLGAGFAGLWSAVGAARSLRELGIGPDDIQIVVVNRTAWHSIRVRNYEADLGETRIPLEEVLGPIGVRHTEGRLPTLTFRSAGSPTRRRVERNRWPMIGSSSLLAAASSARPSPAWRSMHST